MQGYYVSLKQKLALVHVAAQDRCVSKFAGFVNWFFWPGRKA
jgi:hypothetical protein